MPSKSTIQRNLQRARAASFMSDCPQHHLGAVLAYGNKVIAVGWNSTKTNPLQKELNKERNFTDNEAKNNGAIHAELACLLNVKYMDIDYSKACLYIYREHKDGHPALAKPCAACARAIRERGIKPKNVIYTTNELPYSQLA